MASPAADPAHRRAHLRGVLPALALTAWVAACSGDGTASTERTASSDGTAAAVASVASVAGTDRGDGVLPEGFTAATVRITEADGSVCEVCVWLADVADERARGLMGVTDLGAAAGMLFVFESPTASSFYMLDTPTPLSIAWFGADGEHVGSSDMRPCLETPADDCERYGPGVEYVTALEVFSGGLADLGIGAGARLRLVAGSEVAECPVAEG